MQDKKTEAIRNAKPPTTKTELKSFLGIIGFYKKWIRNFSLYAKPLWAISSEEKFKWGKEENEAFETLKSKLINDVVLMYPNPNDFNYYMETDASDHHIGGGGDFAEG